MIEVFLGFVSLMFLLWVLVWVLGVAVLAAHATVQWVKEEVEKTADRVRVAVGIKPLHKREEDEK